MSQPLESGSHSWHCARDPSLRVELQPEPESRTLMPDSSERGATSEMARPASRWRGKLAAASLSILVVLATVAAGVISARQVPGYFGASPMFVWALTTCVAIPALAGLLGAWWRVVLLCVALLPLTLLETVLALRYHARLSPHTFNVMIGTDAQEAQAYLAQFGWLLFAGCSLVFSGGWAAWTLRAPVLAVRVRLKLLSAAAAMAGLLVLACEVGFSNPANSTVLHTHRISWQLLEQVFPWGLPLRGVSLLENRLDQKLLLEQSKNFRFGAAYTGSEKRTVVLVIGESSRRHNWQLNGYPRATNPLLSKRAGLIWLANYTAPAVSTAQSVPLMITRKPVTSAELWGERSIVSAFREAGFGTWWISNQQTAGIHDLQIASYASEAERVVWANVTEFQSRGVDDSALLEPVRLALADPRAQKFIVVHLMGSHFKYDERYPGNATYFHGASGAQAEVDAYDNSIRFTDFVLDSLIRHLEVSGVPAVLVYAADHGQLIAGDATAGKPCNLRWHGYGSEWDVQASALVWAHGIDLGTLTRDRKLSGAGLFDTLADLGQLKISGSDLSQSWLRSQAQHRAVNVLGRVINAEYAPLGACRLLESPPTDN